MNKIVYSGGTFDMFHIGHVELLVACRSLAGDEGSVVVALNTDKFVEAFKGKPPTCSYEERAGVLRAVRYVDLVVCNYSGADSKPTINEVRPDIIAVGSDWDLERYKVQMGFSDEWLSSRGIEIVFVPRTTGVSSSLLKQRVI